MALIPGWVSLGPFRIRQKLGEKFKELHKGKVEDRIIQMVRDDVKAKDPTWVEDEDKNE